MRNRKLKETSARFVFARSVATKQSHNLLKTRLPHCFQRNAKAPRNDVSNTFFRFVQRSSKHIPVAVSNYHVILLSALIFFAFFLHAKGSYAQSVRKNLNRAEEHYKNEDYESSLKGFTGVQLERPDDLALKYNIANSHYKMGNYEEALHIYSDLIINSDDDSLKEKALFNSGNSFFKQGKLEEAAEYYKKTLEIDSTDDEAKKNLEFVQTLIQQMKKEEQQRQEGDEKKEGDEKQEGEERKDGEESEEGEESEDSGEEKEDSVKEGDEGDEERKSAGKSDEGEESDEDKSAKVEGEEELEPISEEEAERLLESITEDRKEFMQRQYKRETGRRKPPDKDW